MPASLISPPRSAAALPHSLLRPLHLWHLLSLDAPSIATLWTAFLARTVGLRLPHATLVSMFLAVWVLYATDRLLDARPLLADPLLPPRTGLEARHLFHHRHRSAFLITLVPVTLALSVLLSRLDTRAIRLDLLLGSLLIGYFVLIHAAPGAAGPHSRGSRLPKELAVGPFFSAACFIPTVARRPDLQLPLAPAALLFAALCSLNCLVIYVLEHPPVAAPSAIRSAVSSTPHWLTRASVAQLRPLALLLLGSALLTAVLGPRAGQPVACVVGLSAVLLLLLETSAGSAKPLLSPLTSRALADLVLATPLLLLVHPTA